MKKITVFALILALIFSLSACGRRREEKETTPAQTTAPTTAPTTEPITVPTLPDMTMPSENIPDPTVDSNSTTPTDGENSNDTTDATENR